MSSSLHDSYATDGAAEEQGTPVEMRGGVIVTIRSQQSKKARVWAAARAKKQRNLIIAHNGVLSPELNDKNEVDYCAEVLVVSWQNVTDREGKPLECTQENVRALMRELPALRRDVVFAASSEETYRPEAREAMGKTSGTVSEPSSDSAAS